MKRYLVALPLVVAALVVGTTSAGASPQAAASVPSTSDPFYAGLAAVPVPGLQDGGTLPSIVAVPRGGHHVLTVVHTAGTLNWGPGSPTFSADGDLTGNTLGGVTNINGYRGISGISAGKDQLFLAGVFLGAAPPKAPAPPRLHVANASAPATLAPRLRQAFPIGDGRTSAGTLQRFTVPAGATRLYLGYVDANGFRGAPGYYADNTGSIRATLRFS
jgi:hypothetical protein